MTRKVARELNIQSASSPDDDTSPLLDRVDTQSHVLGLCLDRLIEDGDPEDLISMVHRQQTWLRLMREHLGGS